MYIFASFYFTTFALYKIHTVCYLVFVFTDVNLYRPLLVYAFPVLYNFVLEVLMWENVAKKNIIKF